MVCNSCGNALQSFNRFCPKCGAPVSPQPPVTSGSPPLYTPPQSQWGPPPQPPKKSGCGKIILILAIVLLLLGAGIVAVIYFGYHKLENTLKSSEAYTVAVNRLKENEEVKNDLGEIQGTGFPLGAFSQRGDGSGDATFVMSVQGTKENGKYEVTLIRRSNVWRLTRGVVHTDSGKTINVAEKTPSESNANDNTNTGNASPEDLKRGRTISGGVLNRKAISLPEPAYPPTAKAVKASGIVIVQVIVDEQGDVISARAISGHPLLKAAAETAARGAKFAPTKLSGKAVKVSGLITYKFEAE